MRNLEWAVGLLVVGCIILFFFPILLGWQLKQDEHEKKMDALPLISILTLLFAMILISELIKLKKEVRKLSKLTRYLKDDVNTLKGESSEK